VEPRRRTRPTPRLVRGVVVSGLLALGLGACVGSSEPRKPTPPPRRSAHPEPADRPETDARRVDRFELLGSPDVWHERTQFLDALRRTSGVRDAWVDDYGKYVVDYDPRRVHRDELTGRVMTIGRQMGRSVEPLWDSR